MGDGYVSAGLKVEFLVFQVARSSERGLQRLTTLS